jgi:hypothetical protein
MADLEANFGLKGTPEGYLTRLTPHGEDALLSLFGRERKRCHVIGRMNISERWMI